MCSLFVVWTVLDRAVKGAPCWYELGVAEDDEVKKGEGSELRALVVYVACEWELDLRGSGEWGTALWNSLHSGLPDGSRAGTGFDWWSIEARRRTCRKALSAEWLGGEEGWKGSTMGREVDVVMAIEWGGEANLVWDGSINPERRLGGEKDEVVEEEELSRREGRRGAGIATGEWAWRVLVVGSPGVNAEAEVGETTFQGSLPSSLQILSCLSSCALTTSLSPGRAPVPASVLPFRSTRAENKSNGSSPLSSVWEGRGGGGRGVAAEEAAVELGGGGVAKSRAGVLREGAWKGSRSERSTKEALLLIPAVVLGVRASA
jgi:hypothetical protein